MEGVSNGPKNLLTASTPGLQDAVFEIFMVFMHLHGLCRCRDDDDDDDDGELSKVPDGDAVADTNTDTAFHLVTTMGEGPYRWKIHRGWKHEI